jgi:hypothetical protein
MNENEMTRIIADALRETFREHTASPNMTTAQCDDVTNILFDVAQKIADEAWPTSSEECPVLPYEWERAVVGE